MVKNVPGIYNGQGVYNIGGGGGGGGIDPEKDILLGGEIYKGVLINNLIWIDRNLNFVFPDLVLNPANLDDGGNNCAYYNKDIAEPFEKAGLLYNSHAVNIIDNFIRNLYPGWRIPYKSDYENLMNYCGGNTQAGRKIKTEDWGGDNEYGFSLLPCGCKFYGANAFTRINEYGYLWTSTQFDSLKNWCYLSYYGDNGFGPSIESKNSYFSVRLCKDNI